MLPNARAQRSSCPRPRDGRRHGDGAKAAAQLVHRDRDMQLLVAVDSHRHQAIGKGHAGHLLLRLPTGMAPTSPTTDSTGTRPDAELLSGHAGKPEVPRKAPRSTVDEATARHTRPVVRGSDRPQTPSQAHPLPGTPRHRDPRRGADLQLEPLEQGAQQWFGRRGQPLGRKHGKQLQQVHDCSSASGCWATDLTLPSAAESP